MQLISCFVDGASHKRNLVISQVFEDSRPKEVEVCGSIALRWTAYTREVLCEDLFLEAINRVWDTLKVFEIGDCASYGLVLSRSMSVASMILRCKETYTPGEKTALDAEAQSVALILVLDLVKLLDLA